LLTTLLIIPIIKKFNHNSSRCVVVGAVVDVVSKIIEEKYFSWIWIIPITKN